MNKTANPISQNVVTQKPIAKSESTVVAQTLNIEDKTYRFPSMDTIQNAIRLAIVDDKPIMMDYWTFSFDKKAFIGVRDTKEKSLVKSDEEYTSTIKKLYKKNDDFIIITENSIYLVPANIDTKRIE